MPLTQKGLLLAGIVDALSTLKENKGSTSKSIINYIQANPLPDMKKRDITEIAIHKAIKQACENRILRHNGGRYCIDFEGMSCLANAARYSLGGRKATPVYNAGFTDKTAIATCGVRTAKCRPRRCRRLRIKPPWVSCRRVCSKRRRRRRRSCKRRRRRCSRRRRRRRRSCRRRRRRRRSCRRRRRRRSCRRRKRRCGRRREPGPSLDRAARLAEPPKRRRRKEAEQNDSMASLGSLPSMPTLDMVDDLSDDEFTPTRASRSGVLVNNMARSFLQKVIRK